MIPTLPTFPAWLSERMAACGFDRTLLARELGVTPQAISDWLTGKYQPTNPKITPLARVLEVDEGEVRRVIVADRVRRHHGSDDASAPSASIVPQGAK